MTASKLAHRPVSSAASAAQRPRFARRMRTRVMLPSMRSVYYALPMALVVSAFVMYSFKVPSSGSDVRNIFKNSQLFPPASDAAPHAPVSVNALDSHHQQDSVNAHDDADKKQGTDTHDIVHMQGSDTSQTANADTQQSSGSNPSEHQEDKKSGEQQSTESSVKKDEEEAFSPNSQTKPDDSNAKGTESSVKKEEEEAFPPNSQTKPDQSNAQSSQATPASTGDSSQSSTPGESAMKSGEEAKTSMDTPAVKNPGALPGISAVVLFHSEYPTMIHTLDTWEKNGLKTIVSEFIFFLNGISSTDEFYTQIPRLRDPQWYGFARVVTSPTNLPLGLAIRQMVLLAKSEYVLLLEKDWALIEPYEMVHNQFSLSVKLLQEQTAQVVRYRHRSRPGAPLYAQITYQGKEHKILQRQTNLYCYSHHWRGHEELDVKYPDYFKKCGSTKSSEGTEHMVWCSKARYCNWTNNPGMFLKKWFMEMLGDPFEKDYNITVAKEPHSNMLDFEFYTNWRADIWNDRDYTVALPLGLFEHQEVGEQTFQNTVWHAWSRIEADAIQKRDEYFTVERKECAEVKKTHDSGPSYKSSFPLDFVHLYHYDKAMNKTVDEGVSEMNQVTEEMRRGLRKGEGTWRNGVTELTNMWYKTVMYTYLPEPADIKMAFTTAVYVASDESQSEEERESKKAKLAKEAAANLNQLSEYGMIVYADSDTKQKIVSALQSDWKWTEADANNKISFVVEGLDELADRLIGSDLKSKVQNILQQAKWKDTVNAYRNATGMSSDVSALPSASQVTLSLLPPLLLRDAEQKSSGRNASTSLTEMPDRVRQLTHLVWFDANSKCIQASAISPMNDHALRGNMMMNIMITGRLVSNRDDLAKMVGMDSGFDADALLTETEVRDVGAGLRIADGRTFGGSRLAVNMLAGYYDSVLIDMVLRRSLVGSAREPLTIALRNVDYNFHFVDAFSACPHGANCGQTADMTVTATDSDKGCRLYEWMKMCAPPGASPAPPAVSTDSQTTATTATEQQQHQQQQQAPPTEQRTEQVENKPAENTPAEVPSGAAPVTESGSSSVAVTATEGSDAKASEGQSTATDQVVSSEQRQLTEDKSPVSAEAVAAPAEIASSSSSTATNTEAENKTEKTEEKAGDKDEDDEKDGTTETTEVEKDEDIDNAGAKKNDGPNEVEEKR